MSQVKNQLEMIKDVEENKVVSDDSNMEVINYEAKRTVRSKNKGQKVHQPAATC
jgi:hypothetical protein